MEAAMWMLTACCILLLIWASIATGTSLQRGVKANEHWNSYRRTHAFLNQFVTEEMVDSRLRELAARFSTAANAQAKELNNPTDQAAINRAEVNLKEAKEAFWKAREEAKFHGFEVQESFKGYLTPQPRTVS